MRELSAPGPLRFVGEGGSNEDTVAFDYLCRLVSSNPRGVELATLTDPPRRIRLLPRYLGKTIGSADSQNTSRTCTYAIDDGPPSREGAHRVLPEYNGMAVWAEDEQGNVTITAFDYPG